jgi:hypothetical protein
MRICVVNIYMGERETITVIPVTAVVGQSVVQMSI